MALAMRRAWQAMPLARSAWSVQALRRFSSDLVPSDALEESSEGAAPWLVLRSSPANKEPVKLPAELNDEPRDAERLSAPMAHLVTEAVGLAHGRFELDRWSRLSEQLKARELNPWQAFLIFHCLVQLRDNDAIILERVVDLIECCYFSMEPGLAWRKEELSEEEENLLRLFAQDENGSFQSLVNGLPLSHKVRLINIRSGRPLRGGVVQKSELPEDIDPKLAWKTVDPLEMEEKERERYEKGRWKVFRMPYVQATERRMLPGKRLRASLASQLFQVLSTADAATLAEISQVCFFPGRLLTGDLDFDFREALAKRINMLSRHELLPYALAFATSMSHCEGPQAYRCWRRKLLPDLLWLMRCRKRSEILQNQQFIHPLLFKGNGLAERSARLLIAVCTAKQVQVDLELLDALVQPLEEVLEELLKSAVKDGSGLSPETVADVLSACVTCKVFPQRLHHLLAELLLKQKDLWKSAPQPELGMTAHGLALLSEADGAAAPIREAVEFLYRSAVLAEAAPAVTLQLLDAVLRVASAELMASKELREDVDEYLVQQMDLDLRALGHIGT